MNRVVGGLCVLLISGCTTSAPSTSADRKITLRDRVDFHSKLSQITHGMPSSQVLSVLGPPDDIRTDSSPLGEGLGSTIKGVWMYGSSDRDSFPVYGQVWIGKDDRVDQVRGARGKPPHREVISEQDLSHMIAMLGNVSDWPSQYDPTPVIRVVNGLRDLGKEKALVVFRETLRVAGPEKGIFLVLRTLFDVPGGTMPPVEWSPVLNDPRGAAAFPRFPVILEGDIPLMVHWGINGQGVPHRVSDHIDYFTMHGRIRLDRLAPVDDPWVILERIERRPGWPLTGGPRREGLATTNMLRTQILRLLASAYRRPDIDLDSGFQPPDSDDSRWAEVVDSVRKIGVRWNRNTSRYVRVDGSVIQ